MKNFRTYELACDFYQKIETLNISGHLRDQLMRAASSIPLNLAEGNAKSSVKEKKRFYQIAYGSLKECEAIFKINRLGNREILDCTNHLGACLYKLIKANITVDGVPNENQTR